ncbi:hypothetical protein CANCADRAFT_104712 [Tortispora caseinolytica NRRL Y-17796]|uniref:Uncharacterized protein n=1 Tax=Tortispora caseinolytica NRRL Y-17796 TaxID=767744 RepID=A0A1E4TEY4_9ASCO|nr:hypothetical protein CANCADRAFT_104712 [Tortispora caseinolytica NRRL Y-17796]
MDTFYFLAKTMKRQKDDLKECAKERGHLPHSTPRLICNDYIYGILYFMLSWQSVSFALFTGILSYGSIMIDLSKMQDTETIAMIYADILRSKPNGWCVQSTAEIARASELCIDTDIAPLQLCNVLYYYSRRVLFDSDGVCSYDINPGLFQSRCLSTIKQFGDAPCEVLTKYSFQSLVLYWNILNCLSHFYLLGANIHFANGDDVIWGFVPILWLETAKGAASVVMYLSRVTVDQLAFKSLLYLISGSASLQITGLLYDFFFARKSKPKAVCSAA